MNYNKIYESLVSRSKNRVLSDDIFSENHHIIPRCFGGKDTPDNLVRLTAREHFVAHLLLWKAARKRYGINDDRTRALANGVNRFHGQQRKYLNSREIAFARQASSERKLGLAPWNKGLSKKTDPKVAQYSQSLSNVRKGKPKSAAWKASASIKRKGRITWNKGIPSKRKECPHCFKLLDAGNFKKSHGDNCKVARLKHY